MNRSFFRAGLAACAIAAIATIAFAATTRPVSWSGALSSGHLLETSGTAGNTIDGGAEGALANLGVGTGLASSGGNLNLTVPVIVADGGTNCTAASATCLDNITGFASSGFVERTGAGAYSFITDPMPVGHGGTNCTSQGITCLSNILGSGTGGQILYFNSGGSIAEGTISGDCSWTNALAITCTKSNGTAFGTAAFDNTGTSGATIPLLNGTNVWSNGNQINENATAWTPLSSTILNVVLADTNFGGIGVAAFANQGGYYCYRADTTNASPSAVQAGEGLCGATISQAYDGSAWGTACLVSIVADDTWSATDHGSGLQYKCQGDATASTYDLGYWTSYGLEIGPSAAPATPPQAQLDVLNASTTTTSSDTTTLGSSSATGTITTATLPSSWPKRGVIQVDSEFMSFTWVSSTSLSITARGIRGSTAATHSCSCTIDFAMMFIGSATNALPELSVMSNGAVGHGLMPPVPTVTKGSINSAAYQSGGTAGVTCSGTPTSSFASSNGIVTHC